MSTGRIIYWMSLLTSLLPISSELLEACSWERLDAECPSGEVILLERARYGRLHLGRCVKQNFGFLGCVADVRAKIDPLCSGRTKCSLDVYQTLQNERPEACSELEAFLQIEYKCVPVVSLPRQQCAERTLSVHDSAGHLPSFHEGGADGLVVGRRGCAVELVARRGQVWNLTLLDFGEPADADAAAAAAAGRTKAAPRKKESIWCTRYAVVKETVDAVEKSSVVCGNAETQTRERNFYLSASNVVTVDLNLDVKSTFLIAFKAVGCAIPDSPNIIHIRKDGNTHTFYCNATGESWSLVCKDSHWQGHHKACGRTPTLSEFRTHSRDWNSTTGLLIVVSLGLVLGVLIGSSLLGLVVCYYKRRYKRAPTMQQTYSAPTYGSGEQKEPGSLYKAYDVEPARIRRQPALSADFGAKSASPSDIYRYPYQTCRPSVPFLADVPNQAIHSPATPARAQRLCVDGDDVTAARTATAITQYGKTGSDTSSSSDHVYEIPS